MHACYLQKQQLETNIQHSPPPLKSAELSLDYKRYERNKDVSQRVKRFKSEAGVREKKNLQITDVHDSIRVF
jgi:hypothetical protein